MLVDLLEWLYYFKQHSCATHRTVHSIRISAIEHRCWPYYHINPKWKRYTDSCSITRNFEFMECEKRLRHNIYGNDDNNGRIKWILLWFYRNPWRTHTQTLIHVKKGQLDFDPDFRTAISIKHDDVMCDSMVSIYSDDKSNDRIEIES